MPKSSILPEMIDLARLIHSKKKSSSFSEKTAIRISHIGKDTVLHFDSIIFPIIQNSFHKERGFPYNKEHIRLNVNSLVFFKMDEIEAVTIAYMLMAIEVSEEYPAEKRKRQPDPKDKIA